MEVTERARYLSDYDATVWKRGQPNGLERKTIGTVRGLAAALSH